MTSAEIHDNHRWVQEWYASREAVRDEYLKQLARQPRHTPFIHKLLSPVKTVADLIGSLVIALIAGTVYLVYFGIIGVVMLAIILWAFRVVFG